MIPRIDNRRDPCVNGRGRRISCAFRRMLMRLMDPSRGRNDAESRLVRRVVSAMRPERLRLSTRKAQPEPIQIAHSHDSNETRAKVHRKTPSHARIMFGLSAVSPAYKARAIATPRTP